MDTWRSDRCGLTGSRSHNSTQRRLRPYGRLSATESALELGSHLSDEAALFRIALLPPLAMGKGLEKVP